jgi:hypothetical protein
LIIGKYSVKKFLRIHFNRSFKKDSPNAYVMDATGKEKNVGEVDVKNVLVTGYCRSCGETLTPERWMVSDDIEKTADQKSLINYIPMGQEAEFSFRGVAFIYNTVLKSPKKNLKKWKLW